MPQSRPITYLLTDIDSRRELTYMLVYPYEANINRGRLSVLAPIGTALLGYRVGDIIEWPTPGGDRRLRVEAISFQPETTQTAEG